MSTEVRIKRSSIDSNGHLHEKRKKSERVCSMNETFVQEELNTKLKNALNSGKDGLETPDLKLVTNPFACCALKNLVTEKEFLSDLENELNCIEMREKNNDLYKFRQSDELAGYTRKSKGKGSGKGKAKVKANGIATDSCVTQFKRMLFEEVKPWIAEITGLELNDKLSMFCAKYSKGDTLLCHDDELEVGTVQQY